MLTLRFMDELNRMINTAAGVVNEQQVDLPFLYVLTAGYDA